MAKTISNSDNIIDSRDVIKRIAGLESERDDLQAAVDEAEGDGVIEATDNLQAWDEDDDQGGELKRLKAFEDELDHHGQTLIRDSYFEDYARELAEDIGAIGKDAPWPVSYIDWEKAADALKSDYTAIEYGDVTYWVQS